MSKCTICGFELDVFGDCDECVRIASVAKINTQRDDVKSSVLQAFSNLAYSEYSETEEINKIAKDLHLDRVIVKSILDANISSEPKTAQPSKRIAPVKTEQEIISSLHRKGCKGITKGSNWDKEWFKVYSEDTKKIVKSLLSVGVCYDDEFDKNGNLK